jgi:chorismate mutase
MSQLTSDLANRRAEIDKFDQEIHRLITERAKVVYGVMRAKAAATAAGEATPPFRPGREAEVLRALVARHEGEFPKSSLLRIWREIVSGATRMQAVQQIAVVGGDKKIWDLARDHFGSGAEYQVLPSINEGIDLLSGMAIAAAIVPMASGTDSGLWWRNILNAESREGAPYVVARLPFFQAGTSGDALVLSAFATDPSSNDRGVIGVALSDGGNQPALVAPLAVAGAKLTAAPIQADNHVWLEVDRLLSNDDPAIAALTAMSSVEKAVVLGGYAVPMA